MAAEARTGSFRSSEIKKDLTVVDDKPLSVEFLKDELMKFQLAMVKFLSEIYKDKPLLKRWKIGAKCTSSLNMVNMGMAIGFDFYIEKDVRGDRLKTPDRIKPKQYIGSWRLDFDPSDGKKSAHINWEYIHPKTKEVMLFYQVLCEHTNKEDAKKNGQAVIELWCKLTHSLLRAIQSGNFLINTDHLRQAGTLVEKYERTSKAIRPKLRRAFNDSYGDHEGILSGSYMEQWDKHIATLHEFLNGKYGPEPADGRKSYIFGEYYEPGKFDKLNKFIATCVEPTEKDAKSAAAATPMAEAVRCAAGAGEPMPPPVARSSLLSGKTEDGLEPKV